jgi:hypothetical protein
MVLAIVAATNASAQASQGRRPYTPEPRFEFTPVAGYQWGGSADFQSNGATPGVHFNMDDSFMWGADLAFRGARESWLELYYRRQDTKLHFNERSGLNPRSGSVDFATNYIHIGGRQEFGINPRIHPYIRGSFGATVFDPKGQGLGSQTNFSLSIGGGLTYMMPSGRVGIRANVQGWFSFASDGSTGVWCDPFFCYAVEGTQTISQGEVSGGLVFRF